MCSRADEQTSGARQTTSAGEVTGKRKRGKYAAKACQYCQRRKIKCDGEEPCRNCAERGHDCLRGDADHAYGDADACPSVSGTQSARDGSTSDAVVGMLIRRLAQVEEQFETIKAANSRPIGVPNHPDSSVGQTIQAHAASDDEHAKGAPYGQGPIWADGHGFVGETSARYNLEQMEDRLDRLGIARPPRATSPPTQPLTRPVSPEREGLLPRAEWRRVGNVQRMLKSHGVAIDGENWQNLLTVYFTEVHPLYPFLHPPLMWDEYNRIWTHHLTNRDPTLLQEDDADIRLAQIFLALACGRCTAARSENNGGHSAGWSFYCVAADLVGDVLNLCGNRKSPLLQLQTLCLMIVYFFRLDANERAQNLLALAVSHAHSLGINRNAILGKMPHFQDEMFRRIWWCIYVLDRRLCLQTGRPFLIVDLNTDTEMPTDLSDTWLTFHRLAKETTSSLGVAILEQQDSCSSTGILYLRAMVGYSRIAGKVWEAVYAIPVATQPLTGIQREYIELLLNRWRDDLPQALIFKDDTGYEMDVSGSHAVMLQSFLLYLRYKYMQLMMRKPVSQPAPNDLDNTFACIRIAHTIIEAFARMSPKWDVLKFPFLTYLLGATMASLSVLVTEPTLRPSYAEATVQAAILLKQSCHASWVSRSTALIVVRLYAIVNFTLLTPGEPKRSIDLRSGISPLRPAAPHENGSERDGRRPFSADPADGVGQVSPVSIERECSLAPKGKTLSRENYDFRIPVQTAARRDRQSDSDIQNAGLVQSASDLSWPEFDFGDIEFEQAISGNQPSNSTAEHEMLRPWSGLTGSWLDLSWAHGMSLDTGSRPLGE